VSSTNIYFGAPQIANNIANIQSVGAVASNRVLRAGDIMTGPLTNEFGYYGDGGGLTNLTAPEATNALALGNQSAATWAAATNANNSAITNYHYLQSLTNTDFESRISGASGFPLTNDVSLAGYAVSNGVLTNVTFYGDGVGMTNVPGTDTNYIAFFGESNVEVRVSTTNIYFGAPQIANNIADIASGSNRAVGVEQTLGGEITNNIEGIQNVGLVATNALPKAGGTMTGALTNDVAYWLPANGTVYFGTSTNYVKDQDGTNFIFMSGTNSANFDW